MMKLRVIRPKGAIKRLWQSGYFKKHRLTREVKDEAFDKFGCTCSNWSKLLKDCRFLRKEIKGWIQKIEYSEEMMTFYVVTGEKPWTDRNEEFINLVNSLQGEILILDPYYGLKSFQILSKFPKDKSIKFMTSQLGINENSSRVSQDLNDFRREFRNIQIKIYRKSYELHDRYIISDNLFVIIGHGLKDLGNKECFLIAIPTIEIAAMIDLLRKRFNERWKKAQNLK